MNRCQWKSCCCSRLNITIISYGLYGVSSQRRTYEGDMWSNSPSFKSFSQLLRISRGVYSRKYNFWKSHYLITFVVFIFLSWAIVDIKIYYLRVAHVALPMTVVEEPCRVTSLLILSSSIIKYAFTWWSTANTDYKRIYVTCINIWGLLVLENCMLFKTKKTHLNML